MVNTKCNRNWPFLTGSCFHENLIFFIDSLTVKSSQNLTNFSGPESVTFTVNKKKSATISMFHEAFLSEVDMISL